MSCDVAAPTALGRRLAAASPLRAAPAPRAWPQDARVPSWTPLKWVSRLRSRLAEQEGRALQPSEPGTGSSRGAGQRGGQGRGWIGSVWGSLSHSGVGHSGDDSGTGQVDPSGRVGAVQVGAGALVVGVKVGEGAGGGGKGSVEVGGTGVPGPLLRLHEDGGGHVRAAGEAQAEEVVEELAFLVVVMEGEVTARGRVGGRGRRRGEGEWTADE